MKRRLRAGAVLVVAGLAGGGVAAVTGIASAKGPSTLQVGHNRSVAGKTENVVVDSKGRTLYTLSGNTTHHLSSCTSANGCFQFWPPVTVHSAHSKLTAAPGIHGKLSIIHRGHIFQIALGSHPLYRYSGDSRRGDANGEGIRTFGGTWHVIGVKSSSSHTPTTTTTTTMPTTSTSTTPTIPYGY